MKKILEWLWVSVFYGLFVLAVIVGIGGMVAVFSPESTVHALYYGAVRIGLVVAVTVLPWQYWYEKQHGRYLPLSEFIFPLR